jgi:hypothetical protein
VKVKVKGQSQSTQSSNLNSCVRFYYLALGLAKIPHAVLSQILTYLAPKADFCFSVSYFLSVNGRKECGKERECLFVRIEGFETSYEINVFKCVCGWIDMISYSSTG